MIDCVIPAAGEARRFGAAKSVLEFEGRPLIRRVIEAARGECRRCVVVTGRYRSEVERSVAGLDSVILVHNHEYCSGMLSSIVAGIERVETPWFFVAPADMPCLSPRIFSILAAVRDDAASTAVRSIAPRFRDRPGHPVLISRTVCGVLQTEWRRYRSMREFLSNYARRAIEVDDPGVVLDIDTPEEWKALESL